MVNQNQELEYGAIKLLMMEYMAKQMQVEISRVYMDMIDKAQA